MLTLAIGAYLVLRIMESVGVFYLAEDIGLIHEIVLLDPSLCEAVLVTLL